MVRQETLLRHFDGIRRLDGGHDFEIKFGRSHSANDLDQKNCGQQWHAI